MPASSGGLKALQPRTSHPESPPLNYRHAFHAGNFADLVKHACLTAALAEMTAAGPPIQVIDTHAGAGLYDLGGEDARRTAE